MLRGQITRQTVIERPRIYRNDCSVELLQQFNTRIFGAGIHGDNLNVVPHLLCTDSRQELPQLGLAILDWKNDGDDASGGRTRGPLYAPSVRDPRLRKRLHEWRTRRGWRLTNADR